MPTNMYAGAVLSVWNKEVDFDSDAINAILLTSTYTPNLDTHRYRSDLTNEVANGNGYATGGVALAGKSIAYTAANSWGITWAATTAKALGDLVRPTAGNGVIYRATTAGTTAGTQPTWPTVIGQTVTDSGVVWEALGRGVVVLDATDPAWPASTITARYMALVDMTPGTDATRPLLALVDFGANISSTSGTLTHIFSSSGIFYIAV